MHSCLLAETAASADWCHGLQPLLCYGAEVKPSDLLESALTNFGAARKATAALLHSSVQSQLLTEDKVCSVFRWMPLSDMFLVGDSNST